MNWKSIFLGATVIGAAVVGGVIIGANCIKKGEQDEIFSTISVENSLIREECSTISNSAVEEYRVLDVVSYEKKYQQEYNCYGYEVIVKNTSGEWLKKVEFSVEDRMYELYDLKTNETYKFVVYDVDNIEIKLMAVYYEIQNFFENEISLKIEKDLNKISGSARNNGERKLYPSQVIYFLKDNDGNTIQSSIEYAGCFFEDRVIRPLSEHKFEIDIPQGYEISEDKPIIFRYSDLSFGIIETAFFYNVMK